MPKKTTKKSSYNKKKAKKGTSKKKVSRVRAFFIRLSVSCIVMGLIAFTAFCGFYTFRAMQFDMEQVAVMPERSVVLDRNGAEIGRMHGQNRRVVGIEDVSQYFLMSIIAREDVRFHEHCGVDFKGLARATLRNVKDRSMTQGASTITMQLSRNTFDLSEGSQWYHELDRKFLEIFVTLRIESAYEKNEILEHYVNRIFWGHSMLGIEAASQAYLQKPAKNLTLSESAMLAGIVRGPNAFSPFRSIKLATRERNTVLDRLVFYHFISPEDAKKAKAERLKIRPKTSRTNKQSYSMDAISRELSYHLEKSNIKIGGLTIHTTIDKGLQKKAELSIEKRLSTVEKKRGYSHQTRRQFQNSNRSRAPQYLQGALVCIDNASGGIVATVGGRSADDSRFNRAYYAKRQVGSLFKPFVFQAAYDRGLRPETFIDDSTLKPGEITHAKKNWRPRNSDGRFLGLIKSKDALIRSRNTSSVRVGDYATLDHVTRAAEIAGFDLFQWDQQNQGKSPNSATAYLGAWEASPEEVARAYTIFPNLGNYKQPYVISKIIDRTGRIVFNKAAAGGVQIAESPLSRGATYEVSKILETINQSGTGASVRSPHGFTSPSGGKTGTTDNYKDAWYAGYTSELTCAVWVGLDTPKTIIDRGYGSTLALPIWADVMKAASVKTEFKPKKLNQNISLKAVEMCRFSARSATVNCRKNGSTYTDQVPIDLVSTISSQCTIHPASGVVTDPNARLEASNQKPLKRRQRSGKNFFERLFGSRRSEQAVVVEDPPPRNNVAPKAIVIDEPPNTPVVAKPILTRPAIAPPTRQIAPPRAETPRAVLVTPPPVQRPRQPVKQPRQPQKAILVEEPQRTSAPQRAIILEERVSTPRAIILD